VEPIRYDPEPLLPDPKLRARVALLDPVDRAALAEALAGNVSAHIVYCVRLGDIADPADFMAGEAVPVTRELSGEAIAGSIQPDGTITLACDGLRLPIALPALAPAILRLVDGRRAVGAIAASLATRGTGPDAFARAWRAAFTALERVNRLLLAAPRED
jgi:hypothetical protein